MDNPLNPNIHTIVKAQIVFLLSTLTEENFEQNQLQIRTVSMLLFIHFFFYVSVCGPALRSHDELKGFGHRSPPIYIQRISRYMY